MILDEMPLSRWNRRKDNEALKKTLSKKANILNKCKVSDKKDGTGEASDPDAPHPGRPHPAGKYLAR